MRRALRADSGVVIFALAILSLAAFLAAGYLLSGDPFWSRVSGEVTRVIPVRNDGGKNPGDPYVQVSYRFDANNAAYAGLGEVPVRGSDQGERLRALYRRAAAFPVGATVEVEHLKFAPDFNYLKASREHRGTLFPAFLAWAAVWVVLFFGFAVWRASRALRRRE